MIEPEDEMLDLARSTPSRQTGAEPFTGLDAGSNLALLDFWQWAYSDLLSNTNRGRLAEFIVARAIGLGLTDVRTEWDAFDLVTSTGVKVEVKSAAYVQRWFQKKLSVICFDVSPRREWSDATNQVEAIPRRHADVYVFALLAHQDKASINPLDLGQWRFYVAPAATLGSRNSVTLKTLEALPSTSGPVTFAQLHEVVEHAALRREDVSNALRG